MWMYEGLIFGDQEERYPIRIDSFLSILVLDGGFSLGIDGTTFELSAPSVIILIPGNHLTGFALRDNEPVLVRATGISTGENKQNEIIDDVTDFVIKTHLDPVTPLVEDASEQLTPYLDFLQSTLAQSSNGIYHLQKAVCILKALIFGVMDCVFTTPTGISYRNHETTALFKNLLAKNFRQHREVEYYASLLGITPKHLSTVMKKTYGMTAGNWIESYVVREAQMLLFGTNMQIKEIAVSLNFSSQTLFGKYFRKSTGITPTEFRKRLGMN